MANLYVKNVPDAVYRRFQKIAATYNRSLSAHIIALMEEAIRQEEVRRAQVKLLADIRKRRWMPPKGAPESVEVIRELRDERDAQTLRD
jgi:plasmid stability protein